MPTGCSHRCARWAHEDWTVSDLLGQCKTKNKGKKRCQCCHCINDSLQILFSVRHFACSISSKHACKPPMFRTTGAHPEQNLNLSLHHHSVQVQLLSHQGEIEGKCSSRQGRPVSTSCLTLTYQLPEDSVSVSAPHRSRSCPPRQGS